MPKTPRTPSETMPKRQLLTAADGFSKAAVLSPQWGGMSALEAFFDVLYVVLEGLESQKKVLLDENDKPICCSHT